MKAIMVMFDSLNRHMLPCYGCDWTHAPNFKRLAERAVTFDKSYVCSMPCMPARRDLHTGRPNFLHRGWGPLEPFDDSMPQMLGENGIYTHLITDHYHYFEDGGCTYHNRYQSWQFNRGQEGDPWIGQVDDPHIPRTLNRQGAGRARQDWVNRAFLRREIDQPQAKTFDQGLDFIRRNCQCDRWFLQMETFDPHEPFFTQRTYKDLYPHDYAGPHFDWPYYREVTESRDQVQHCRYEYAALLSMCDAHLGDVLDLMDELNLWDDTMLIVWTDHGFMLGENGYWAKVWLPYFEEIAHTPFFVWDPRCRAAGERRSSLVQPSIDLGPTLLEFFGLAPTTEMLGQPLGETVATDQPVRDACLFGAFGKHVNITDGRYVYMRAPPEDDNGPLHHYTLMPTHMTKMFSASELGANELADPFTFTKGCRTLKIAADAPSLSRWGTRLYDLENDPAQQTPLTDPNEEGRLVEHLVRLMRACDAPPEQFERLGLSGKG